MLPQCPRHARSNVQAYEISAENKLDRNSHGGLFAAVRGIIMRAICATHFWKRQPHPVIQVLLHCVTDALG
jgi:hypothetical protein